MGSSKNIIETVGWDPSCDCDADIIPCTVLDPFGGSGTTGAVCIEEGRSFILIEMNPDYVKNQLEKRIMDTERRLNGIVKGDDPNQATLF